MNKIDGGPSIVRSFIMIVVYLFAAIPVTIGAIYWVSIIGYTSVNLRSYLSEIILMSQVFISTILVFLLLKNFYQYFLSNVGEKKYFSYLVIGIKWALPLIAIHAFSLIIPAVRENLIYRYLGSDVISVKGASNLTLSLYSIWLISGAIFEELFFRGIIVNRLIKVTNSIVAVIISAGLFALSHFVFAKISAGGLTSSFIVGILCGFAYTSSGSCISAILPHLINNFICAVFVWALR